MSKSNTPKAPQELTDALRAVKQHFIYAWGFSAASNILHLVPILYMLQIYDRVLSSGSYSTLAALTVLVLCLMIALGGFDWVRSRILIAASNKIETALRDRVFSATFKLSLLSSGSKSSAQPLSDLAGLRQFLTSNGIITLFDAPWFPIYLLVLFMFHFWFGIAALVAGLIMVALAIMNEKATGERLKQANSEANTLTSHTNSSLRNAEVIEAMGMGIDIRRRMQRQNDQVLALQAEASRKSAGFTTASRTFRMTIRSMMLCIGAILALRQEITAGTIIAGALLTGRALEPISLLVSNWKSFITARGQYERLGALLEQIPADTEHMRLPAPLGNLSIEQLYVAPPGTRTPVLRGINLHLAAGEALGIIGPSASGKSSLARAILGIWPAAAGKVRLDSADISVWNRHELGPHIGYLPQDIELFDGSIADNICRLGDPDPERIVTAAQMAGIHDMVLRQPDGYDTLIGGAGGVLSGGQRQRIGLARAIYGNPKLLVLDEPNSNLDDQGEKELVAALQRVKASGCTVVIISHRTLVLSTVDKILLLKDGQAMSFGPRDQVLAQLSQSGSARPALGSA